MSADPSRTAGQFSMAPLPPDSANDHSHRHCAQCTGASLRQSTGWDAVEMAFKEFDEQELEDYKDDIDTLLVFAGLYSAVLTAFVIVSYPLLQEDTAGQSLQVLRQIASQHSDISAQLSNPSTIAPLSPLPPQAEDFVPSPTAIRVNVMWFASLVISLSTASLGILVKQWLREYMSFVTSSSQGQLRVRHFRRKGLETWKVFGIASALPLLLQLALLLFFVGLCYFTADIHTSLRNTTLPLVCAWGFVVFSVTIVPIFSARCPYKTPALISLVAMIRTRVYQRIAAFLVPRVRIIANMAELIADKSIGLLGLPDAEQNEPAQAWLPGRALPTWVLRSKPYTYGTRIAARTERLTRHIYHISAKAICSLITICFIPGPFWLILFISPLPKTLLLKARASTTIRRPPEEPEVLKDTSQDLEILVSVDTLQANDELLGTTMNAALQHSKPTWKDAIVFLVKIIANRVPLPAATTRADDVSAIDVRLLSQRARDAIADIFRVYVLDAQSFIDFCIDLEPPVTLETNMNRAIDWTVCLFTSLYDDLSLAPTAHSRLLLQCFAKRDPPHEDLNTILFGSLHPRTERERNVLKWFLSSASAGYSEVTGVSSFVVSTRIIRAFRLPEIAAEVDLPRDLRDSLDIIATSIFEQIYHIASCDTGLPDQLVETFSDAVYQAVYLFSATPADLQSSQLLERLTCVCSKLFGLTSKKPLQSFLLACIKHGPSPVLDVVSSFQAALWGLARVNYDDEAIEALRASLQMLATQNLTTSEALRICCVVLRVVKDTASTNPLNRWRGTFDTLAELLRNSSHRITHDDLLESEPMDMYQPLHTVIFDVLGELASIHPAFQAVVAIARISFSTVSRRQNLALVRPTLLPLDNGLVEWCWRAIAEVDQVVPTTDSGRPPQEYTSWVQNFNEKNSAVGDYFCLMLTLCNEQHSNWRARRLSAMTPEERRQILTSGVMKAREERETHPADIGPSDDATPGQGGSADSRPAAGANAEANNDAQANSTHISDSGLDMV